MKIEKVSINNVAYVREDQISSLPPKLPGKRAVVVCDRGWVFAGDVSQKNGRIRLSRAVHVRSWSTVGFDGMIAGGGTGPNVVARRVSDVDLPEGSEIFRVPVSDTWGLP